MNKSPILPALLLSFFFTVAHLPLLAGVTAANSSSGPLALWSLDKLVGKGYPASGTSPALPAFVIGRAEPSPGRLGGALGFSEETPGLVMVPFVPASGPGPSFTIAFWLRPATAPKSYGTCIDFGAKKGLALSLNNQGKLSLSADDRWHALITPHPVAMGEWIRVALVLHESRLRLYLDGRASGEIVLTNPPQFPPTFQLGAHVRRIRLPDGSHDEIIGSPLTGDIDEIAIHARPLSDAELLADAR